MDNSILNTVKKNLGLDPSYEAFDPDILMHINTVLSTLNDLGIGPDEGFFIQDATPTWDDFMPEAVRDNRIITYTYLAVRMYFDPPQNSWGVGAMKEQLEELAWRITRRQDALRAPVPVLLVPDC